MKKAIRIYKDHLKLNVYGFVCDTVIKQIEKDLVSTLTTCAVSNTMFVELEVYSRTILSFLDSHHSITEKLSANVQILHSRKVKEFPDEIDYAALSSWHFPLIEEEPTLKRKLDATCTSNKIRKFELKSTIYSEKIQMMKRTPSCK
jgi:hypothetical protein